MSKLERYFSEYAEFHRTSGNQRTHILGIPMIMVSILAWSSSWVWIHPASTALPASLFQLDLGVLIIACASAWYLYLDWRTALGFVPALYGVYWLGRATPDALAWVLFFLGWTLQLVGHSVFEKKSPAFTRNLEHLLIGPIWLFVKILHLRE